MTAKVEIDSNHFKDIQQRGTDGNSAIVLISSNVTMKGRNHIRHNHFDNRDAGQAVAIYADGVAGANSTKPSNLYIEDNSFDGFTNQSLRMNQMGSVTVRNNIFHDKSASRANTTEEETATTKVMFTNFNTSSNRKIATWYPTTARLRGKVLEIDVRPNTSGNSPKTPVTIDVYHTAGHTAEMIVGSAEMAEAGTIRLPANGVPPGSIRIQTHSKPDEGGQPESSQFSRTVPIVHEIADPSVQIEKRAWLDVPGDAPGFEDVLAEGTEIDTDSEVPAGTTIWWTYAVTNDGGVPLTRIAVEDDALGRQVCVIESLEPDATRGCTASGPVEAQP